MNQRIRPAAVEALQRREAAAGGPDTWSQAARDLTAVLPGEDTVDLTIVNQ
jgi:hypothetical protein